MRTPDLVENDSVPELATARHAAVAEARQQFSGPNLERFDAALAYAELVYAVREDNVLLTCQLPTGLLRRMGLAIGRRLVAAGQLGRREDAVMLTGVAASPGRYRGRVRIIRCASELGKVRPGEVLVCPITTAAWTVVFQRAGAEAR